MRGCDPSLWEPGACGQLAALASGHSWEGLGDFCNGLSELSWTEQVGS